MFSSFRFDKVVATMPFDLAESVSDSILADDLESASHLLFNGPKGIYQTSPSFSPD
jgi:hypothetical protein